VRLQLIAALIGYCRGPSSWPSSWQPLSFASEAAASGGSNPLLSGNHKKERDSLCTFSNFDWVLPLDHTQHHYFIIRYLFYFIEDIYSMLCSRIECVEGRRRDEKSEKTYLSEAIREGEFVLRTFSLMLSVTGRRAEK
jgi:hypothetical protein